MGSIFGGGGGGGSGGGDTTDSKVKQLPSPEAIAAMRAAANTASGVAGVAKNLPYNAMIASSPGYRQALQNTANTWGNWMGTAPMDLSQGMPPITQSPQFGSVIDAGAAMNSQIAQLPPGIQYMLSQWAGPGPVTPGSPYDPIRYDPYVNQIPLLHGGTAAQGGVGQIGSGGIPTTTLPATIPPPGGPGTGGGGPGPTGPQVNPGPIPTPRPRPAWWPPDRPWPPTGVGGGGLTGGGAGQGWRQPVEPWILAFRRRLAAHQGGEGGMGSTTPTGQGFGHGFEGGWASHEIGAPAGI